MNDLQVFTYNENEVRTVEHNGEIWWVLADVCNVLEIKNGRDVLKRLDPDEKGVDFIYTLGGEQEVTIINEPGLYSVILRSNKPEAKAFKRWLTHEVLPAIHKTGSYSVAQSAPDSDIAVLAEEVKELRQMIAAQTVQVEARSNGGSKNYKIDSNIAGREERRRWFRKFNERINWLQEKFRFTRNELIHQLYVLVEENKNVVLEAERIRCIEQLGLDDCSCLEAIYYIPALRKEIQRVIDLNLKLEVQEW